MKYKKLFILLTGICLLCAACNSSIEPANLYGRWEYVKVANPNSNPPDSVSTTDLQINTPYIQFSKDSLLIYWGGKVLARGSYRIDGKNIRFKQMLEGGKVREFPFWISKLDNYNLVFETTGEDGSRVTAVRR